MLPLTQVELEAPRPQADLRPLIESIRAHGIVHPLLVRRQDSRFMVVAGRKRLLAAQMLRLQTVPCLVHELTDSEAAALAAADNPSVGQSARIEGSPDFAGVRRLIATHVATIRSCADIGNVGSATPACCIDRRSICESARLARRPVAGGG
jgi:ParB family chromosome partitioning protein